MLTDERVEGDAAGVACDPQRSGESLISPKLPME